MTHMDFILGSIRELKERWENPTERELLDIILSLAMEVERLEQSRQDAEHYAQSHQG